MSTAAGKLQKPRGAPAPARMTPRPTAASTARAARNATNRNVLTHPLVGSPSRTPVSPAQVKPTTQRSSRPIPKNEDKDLLGSSENLINIVNKPVEESHDNLNEQDSIIDEMKSDPSATNTIVKDQAGSRPQTPVGQSQKKDLSRPVTPRTTSRPSTPSSTPQHQHPQGTGRPKTPVISGPTRSQTRLPAKNAVDTKVAFVTKQRQFYRMKKELDFKQQAILDVYESLRNMHSRLNEEGLDCGGEGNLDKELVLFNVADWTAAEIAQLCKDAAQSSCSDNAFDVLNSILNIDDSALEELNTKIMEVPTDYNNFCVQTLQTRQELVHWVKELIDKHEVGSGESYGRIEYYASQTRQLNEALYELKTQSDSVVEIVTQLLRRAFIEQKSLVTVGESLVREVARLRQDLEARVLVANVGRDIARENNINKTVENELRRELEEEKLARSALKDKLVSTESQLRQTRARVTKMDKQLKEAEATIASLAGSAKTLEDKSREKESQLEARARKLKENLKTGEVANNQLIQQRDALLIQVKELDNEIKNLAADHESAIKDLYQKLSELNIELSKQTKQKEEALVMKEQMMHAYNDSQKKIEELSTKLSTLQQLKPSSELPTEKEVVLLAELQAAKESLWLIEDEFASCKREKVRFLETFTKITDNGSAMHQKLASELASKEELVAKLQKESRELVKNVKLYEQKIERYEQYITELQALNRAVAATQGAENMINYQDTQEEVANLKMSLLDATQKNEELTEMLAEKEHKLEQQGKASRAQARVIKVREELIILLKNKETEQSQELMALQRDLEHRMKIVEEVNRQIASKADEIQELFATLECKQQQIHRLEKIVLALEEQQKRSQAQRTRQEEKIAELEHELADGNKRERKFLFF